MAKYSFIYIFQDISEASNAKDMYTAYQCCGFLLQSNVKHFAPIHREYIYFFVKLSFE